MMTSVINGTRLPPRFMHTTEWTQKIDLILIKEYKYNKLYRLWEVTFTKNLQMKLFGPERSRARASI